MLLPSTLHSNTVVADLTVCGGTPFIRRVKIVAAVVKGGTIKALVSVLQATCESSSTSDLVMRHPAHVDFLQRNTVTALRAIAHVGKCKYVIARFALLNSLLVGWLDVLFN